MHIQGSKFYWLLLPLLMVVFLVLIWDWQWFKPLLERQASAAIGRPVHIGQLQLTLSRQPLIHLERISLANPDGFDLDSAPLATVASVVLRVDLADLFKHRLRIVSLDIDRPRGDLRTAANGVRNWQFRLAPPEPTSQPTSQPWLIAVEQLAIHDGEITLLDAQLKADLYIAIRTDSASADGEHLLHATASGSYDNQPIKLQFIGGSILRLRSPENPYPVDFIAESGDTRIALKGSLLDPLQFAGAKLRLLLQGKDLAALYAFVKLPLPNTPPYQLQGDLDYQASRVYFRNFKGLMGESDLAGSLSVLMRQPRPLLEAHIQSEQLRLVDLSGLIGGKPDGSQKIPRSDGRLLPATPVNLPKLHSADVNLEFVGAHIVGEKTPFDSLRFKLNIDDGVLRVSPADFGVGPGVLRLYATLDPRGENLGLNASAELQRLDVARLMAASGYHGSGRLGGYAKLKSTGNSAAELLGRGNGELKLAMTGGDFSALLLDLSGLDFGNALIAALGIQKRTEVRCLVGDFALKDGLLDTRSFVLDTGNTNLVLDGQANLRDETLAMNITTRPKRANIGRLKAPIHISGSFADPKLRPDLLSLGLRSAAAIALGTLLTPLAALLPTLQLGLGEDHDCKALLAAAEVATPAAGG